MGDRRILVAARTLEKAREFRDHLGLPEDTRLASLRNRGAGRGMTVDLLLIERSAATQENLAALLPCTFGVDGRAYFIEPIG